MNEPKISVVIPVYNEERYIGRCLDSLLKQSYKNVEIIAVDDGSKDESVNIIKKYPVILIQQNHLGPGAARNHGAERSSGDILVFVDADMEFDSRYIEKLTEPIRNGEVIGTHHLQEKVANLNNIWALCSGRSRVPIEHLREGEVFRAILKSEFTKVGGFDPIAGACDDSTVSKKLKIKSIAVDGAICYHYNIDNLKDMFYSAMWMGNATSIGINTIRNPRFLEKLSDIALVVFFGAVFVHKLFIYLLIFLIIIFFIRTILKAVTENNIALLLFYPIFTIISSIGYFVGLLKRSYVKGSPV